MVESEGICWKYGDWGKERKEKWEGLGAGLGRKRTKSTHIKTALHTQFHPPLETFLRMPHIIKILIIPPQTEPRRRIPAPRRRFKVPKRRAWIQRHMFRVRPARRERRPVVDRLWQCTRRGDLKHEWDGDLAEPQQLRVGDHGGALGGVGGRGRMLLLFDEEEDIACPGETEGGIVGWVLDRRERGLEGGEGWGRGCERRHG
jgi:hypothetical protein